MRGIPRKLIYRHPRFRVDLPVVVHDGQGRRIAGRCSEVSSEGAGLRLLDVPFLEDSVRIEIGLEGRVVSLPARLVHRREGNRYGLCFEPASADEHEAIKRMVASVQHNPFL